MNDGTLEYWNDGILEYSAVLKFVERPSGNIPIFQSSIIPFFRF
jgi:hypothetical protein